MSPMTPIECAREFAKKMTEAARELGLQSAFGDAFYVANEDESLHGYIIWDEDHYELEED